MTLWRRSNIVVLCVFLVAILVTPFFVISGDPGPDIEPGMTPKDIKEALQKYEDDNRGTPYLDPSGVYFCSIKSRDDVFQANMFRLEVKVYPSNGRWPGVEIDPIHNVAKEVVETVWIKIRGIDVPGMHESIQPDYENKSHVRIARHRQRHAEGSHYAWDMLNRVEIKWLTNPKRIEGTVYVTCDLYLEIAGVALSFSDMLEDEGYGLPIKEDGDRYDWGRRLPKLIN